LQKINATNPNDPPLIFNDEILPVILHFGFKVYSPNEEIIKGLVIYTRPNAYHALELRMRIT
jgi:hypothetical protein